MLRKAKYYLLCISLLFICLIAYSFTNTIHSEQPSTLAVITDSIIHNKIIVIGDTQHKSFLEYFIFHEDNAEETRKLFKKIASEEPSIVVHLGDVTAYGSSLNQWENFEEDIKPLTDKNIQIYPVFGNHDYYGNNDECYDNFFNHFPQINKRKWYSFVNQKIGFVMLNSNFDNLSNNEIITQKNWYKNILDSMENNSDINFIIVCSHHPPYTNSKVVSSSEEIRNNFGISFQSIRKGAIFFSGHCHSYEKFTEGGKYFIVSGGGGGSRQRLDVDKNTREFKDLFSGPEIRFFHFCEIETFKDSLKFKVIKLNEDNSFSIADELTIFKNK
jgi:predicted phosphodiesterase